MYKIDIYSKDSIIASGTSHKKTKDKAILEIVEMLSPKEKRSINRIEARRV